MTTKMIAGILAGAVMLSCVSAGAESTDNYSVTVNEIDKSLGIVIDEINGTTFTHKNPEQTIITIPDYKNGKKAQKLNDFVVSKGEAAYLKFDMIDSGTGEDTCDITLYETLTENGKTIENVVATIENLKLKSTLKINNLSPDKKYYFTVQSKTKTGNASFLFWTDKEMEVKFDLQNPSSNDDKVNNLVDLIIPNQGISTSDSEWLNTPNCDEYFETLKEYGIFAGYDDGEAKPNNVITRAETAKALCVALGINPESATKQHFSDVDSSHWAYKYINALADMKIVAGTENNLFEPNREATINEVVKMLVCALGYEPQADMSGGYPDGYIQTAKGNGLLKNLEQMRFVEPCQRYVAFILFHNALDIPFLVQTGYDNGSAEFAVADGKDGRDYTTMRYKITDKRKDEN